MRLQRSDPIYLAFVHELADHLDHVPVTDHHLFRLFCFGRGAYLLEGQTQELVDIDLFEVGIHLMQVELGDELGDFLVDLRVLGGEAQLPDEGHLDHVGGQHLALVRERTAGRQFVEVPRLVIHQTEDLSQQGKALVIVIAVQTHVLLEELDQLFLVGTVVQHQFVEEGVELLFLLLHQPLVVRHFPKLL